MFRALLAHHQETLHVCSFGDYFVLKFIVSSCKDGYMLCRIMCVQYIVLDLNYIGLDMSESKNIKIFR
jgi:hypothetical protein